MKKIIFTYLLIVITLCTLYAQQRRDYTLFMRNQGTHTLHDGQTIRLYGFANTLSQSPSLPGPLIYAEEGDTVVILARNVSQGEPHTIHLHGLDVDMANDGVGHLSFEIHHAEEGTYEFVATHAGTYLYHCHVASIVHVQMGMYGLVIVAAKNGEKTAWTNGPSFDKEYAWLMSEVDKSWHDNPPQADSTHTYVYIPPYAADYFLVNGKSQQQLTHESTRISGKAGEKIYLRLANVGFYMNKVIFPSHFNATIIDSDGRPLPASFQSDTLLITSGERYGVMLTPSEEISGTVKIQYLNKNNFKIEGEELIPYEIEGNVGIHALILKHQLKVYPNPSSGNIFILPEEDISGQLIVSGSDGKIILSQQVRLEKNRAFSVGDLSAGMKFIRLIAPGNTYTGKVFIVH